MLDSLHFTGEGDYDAVIGLVGAVLGYVLFGVVLYLVARGRLVYVSRSR